MITYTLTEAEVARAQVDALNASPILRIARWLWFGLFVWSGVRAAELAACDCWSAAIDQLTIPAILLWILVFPYITMPRGMRILYRGARWLREPQTLSWSSDGIHLRSAISDLRPEWRDLGQWDETKTLLRLSQATIGTFIVPKRAFSEEQLGEFRDLLASRLRRASKWSIRPR